MTDKQRNILTYAAGIAVVLLLTYFAGRWSMLAGSAARAIRNAYFVTYCPEIILYQLLAVFCTMLPVLGAMVVRLLLKGGGQRLYYWVVGVLPFAVMLILLLLTSPPAAHLAGSWEPGAFASAYIAFVITNHLYEVMFILPGVFAVLGTYDVIRHHVEKKRAA